jgi:hypothetical protein
MAIYNRRIIIKKAQQRQKKDELMVNAQNVRFSSGKKPAIEGLPI